MRGYFSAFLGLSLLVATDVSADGPPTRACSLLTSAEIGAELGVRAGQPQETAVPITEGPSKGQTMAMCNWPVGNNQGVSLAMIKVTPGTDRAAFMATMTKALETLKAQGWKEERKEFGSTQCIVTMPPKDRSDLPNSTGCFAEASGKGITVGANTLNKVPMEKVKALLDKAMARVR